MVWDLAIIIYFPSEKIAFALDIFLPRDIVNTWHANGLLTDATMGFVLNPRLRRCEGAWKTFDFWLVEQRKVWPFPLKFTTFIPLSNATGKYWRFEKKKILRRANVIYPFQFFFPHGANVIVNCRVWLFSFHISTVRKGCWTHTTEMQSHLMEFCLRNNEINFMVIVKTFDTNFISN